MIQKITFLLVLIYSVLTSQATQNDQGSGAGVFSTQTMNHILMSSREIGRTIDIPIKYTRQFDSLPKIAIATSLIDLESGSSVGYGSEVIDVDQVGFTIRVTALSEKHINSIAFNWFATTNEHIFIQYIDTQELLNLQQGQGTRSETSRISTINSDQQDVILAASYLNGVSFGEGERFSIQQKVTGINHDTIDISFLSTCVTPVLRVQVCLVYTSLSESFNTGELGLRVDNEHQWLQTNNKNLVNIGIDFDIPSEMSNKQKFFISGLTGFEAPSDTNLRINIQEIQVDGEHATLSYGTCINISHFKGVTVSLLSQILMPLFLMLIKFDVDEGDDELNYEV